MGATSRRLTAAQTSGIWNAGLWSAALWMAALGVPGVAIAGEEGPVLVSIPDGETRVAIRSQSAPEAGRGRVVVRSKVGIFRLTILPLPKSMTQLELVVENERFAEGVEFQPGAEGDAVADAIDLRQAAGVTIASTARGIEVRCDLKACPELRRGGRLQFVNQYRN